MSGRKIAARVGQGVAAFDPEEGGIVSAGGVGFDISCGVRTLETGLTLEDVSPFKERLATALSRSVPAGVGSHGRIELDDAVRLSRDFLDALFLFLAVLTAGCGRMDAANREKQSEPAAASSAGSTPSNDDGDWSRPGKDEASTRFSDLSEITRDSVRQLGPKVIFSTGYLRGHEAPPLVVNGSMYIVTPYPNVLYAIDLSQPGIQKWKYEPKP